MTANLKKMTIEMTPNEAKAAGKIGSEKLKELREYQAAYPSFSIDIKAPAKRKATYSGLTYKYMTTYIESCKREDKEQIKAEFNTLIALDKKNGVEGCEHLEAAGYLDVKEWFLAKFPEIEKVRKARHEEIQKILRAA